MNPRLKLVLSGIGVIVLTIIALAINWPQKTIPVGKNMDMILEKPISNDLNAASNPPQSPAPIPVPTPTIVVTSEAASKVSKFPEGGLPVLMYHSISTIPGNTLGVPVKQFTEEMEWLHRQNYQSITMDEFYQALVDKGPLPEKPILLTFDDGYADNYKTAWPIMQRYGFKATFFIITSSVGPKTINWDELNDLVRQGNSIGSHTVRHLDLSTLSVKQQENELSISKQELENRLGISVQALCYPSGKYNNTTLELMPKLGYKLGFTTKPGRVNLSDNPLELKRVRIPGGMPIEHFRKLFP